MISMVNRLSLVGALLLSLVFMPTFSGAVPLSPVFGPETKLIPGQATSPGGKNVAAFGAQVYVALLTAGDDGTEVIRVARIGGTGTGVVASGVAVSRPNGVLTDELAIAVSSGKAGKADIVHLLWNQQGGGERGLFYSWAAADNLGSWSPPLRVNGSNAQVTSATIVVGPQGVRHLVFIGDGPRIYLTSAPAGSDKFPAPAPVPGNPHFDSRDLDAAVDRHGTLHLAFMATKDRTYGDGGNLALQYTRLDGATGRWTAPQELLPLTAVSDKGNVAIAAGGSRIYIASTLGNRAALDLFRSSDSGVSWTKNTVATGQIDTSPTLAVAADGTVTVAATFALPEGSETRIYRSDDGSAWGPATVIPNRFQPIIVLDDWGKAALFSKRLEATNSEDALYLFREK